MTDGISTAIIQPAGVDCKGKGGFFAAQHGENKKVLDKSTSASYNDTGIF